MNNIEYLKKYFSEIEENVGKKRFEHCLRTGDCAKELAKIHNEDPEKAYIAGVFHDCCKYKNIEELQEICKQYDSLNNFLSIEYKNILHAKLGAIIAEEKYEINDEDILNAISYHATARENMSKLEMIIYIADKIERGRIYKDVDLLREFSHKNLNTAMLKTLAFNIKKLLDSDEFIVLDTIKAYNYYTNFR